MKARAIFNAVVVLSLGVCSTPAFADLILTIDSSAETISFGGSGSGLPSLPGPEMIWQIGPAVTWPNSVDILSGINFSEAPLLGLFEAASDSARLYMFFNTTSAKTFVGNGASFSYAGFGQPEKDYLASLTSTDVLSIAKGSVTQNVQINAVPEPSSVLLGGLGALLVAGAGHARSLLRRR